MNPYEINKNKQKILEYMKLEDIIKDSTTKDIFRSPLTVSIIHRLTYEEDEY